ncbi:hypothetical protein EsDP_00004886 [Epichloe bromicola]|uniref:Centromere/microtubule binding protein cbf5-like protein n=1 Tax=Epichloe bromicola TaxID=79588 RepID=A0ABQ0CT14_9HYPO
MLRSLTFLSALLPVAQAMLCPAKSQCASNCGNVLAATSPDDLVCDQMAFKSDPTGQLFAGCVECQRSSTYYSGNDSDVQAMLYNVRYALSYCVWGNEPLKNPRVVDTPCITSKACGPFKDAVQFKNLSTEYDAFQYCDVWPTDDSPDFHGCTDCLQAEGRYSMANFVIALQAGCQQKPAPGLFIGLDGGIFSQTAVQISTPSPTARVDPDWFDKGPLTLGAKVGIAIGGLVGVLILLGCGIILNGKQRRRAYLRTLHTKYAQKGWPTLSNQREMGEASGQQPFRGPDDTSLSHRPLRGWDDTSLSQQSCRDWDDSPMTTNSEQHYPRYFSPYSSRFNSPISAQEGQAMPWPPAALAPKHHIGSVPSEEAGGAHWSHNPVSEDKGKSKVEAYEMHEVDTRESGSSKSHLQKQRNEAPVLSHPGYGRQGDTPPAPYNYTERDVNNGNAI